MSFVDKSLKCVDCGAEFTFSVQDQEFHQSRGYTNEPRRCSACRQARRGGSSSGGGSSSFRREMYPAVCAQCKAQTQVPFQPRGDRPVYCSDCYNRIGPNSSRR